MEAGDRRRALVRLSTAYALGWMTVAMVAGPGSAAWVRLAGGNLGTSGFFIATYFLFAAAGGFVGGRAIDRWGRRRLLTAAYLLAAVGFAVAGAAMLTESLILFGTGVAVIAVGAGVFYLTRAAVAGMYPTAERGRAVAALQFAVTAGAILGPLVLLASGPLEALLGRDPMALIWFVAPPILVVAAIVAAAAPLPPPARPPIPPPAGAAPMPHPATPSAPPPSDAAPVAPTLPWFPLATGVAALALAQAAMIMAMGVTGAAMASQGHGLEVLGLVMAFHFLGMFALSRQVGAILDAHGRRPAILAGLGLLVVGGILLATISGLAAFGVALFLVGLGWSFAYTGGTVLVADVSPAGKQGRIMGTADMLSAILAAAAATGGGWWYSQQGQPGLGVMAVLMVLPPLVMALMFREIRAKPAPDPTPGDL